VDLLNFLVWQVWTGVYFPYRYQWSVHMLALACGRYVPDPTGLCQTSTSRKVR
jgi:hypothetical protein